ncbi:MAG: T9SS type A sorting domain-containing protein [Bacteroidota bacterium]
MKKFILLVLILIFYNSCYGQWVQQAVGWENEMVATNDIKPIDQNHLWAFANKLGNSNTFFQYQRTFARSSDGGNSWDIAEVNAPDSCYREFVLVLNFDTTWIQFTDVNNNFDRPLFKTINGGLTWQQQYPPWNSDSTQSIKFIHFFDNLHGIAMGIQATNISPPQNVFMFYQTYDCGNTWTQVPASNIPITPIFEYLDAYSQFDSCIWITTSEGRILKSQDYGMHWNLYTTPFSFTGNFIPIFKSTSHGILYNGFGNIIYSTSNGGLNWNSFIPTGPIHSHIFHLPGDGTIYLSISSTGCSYSNDECHTWTDFPELVGKITSSVAFCNKYTGWVGSNTFLPNPSTNGLFKFTGALEIPSENKENIDAKIIPNPSSGYVKLSLTNPKNIKLKLHIINSLGQIVFSDQFYHDNAQSEKDYNLSFLNPGIYNVVISSDEVRIRKSLVIL